MQALLGLLFPLLPVPGLPRHLSPGEDEAVFFTWVCCCPWIRPQLPHTVPTGASWAFCGVVPLPGPQNRTQGHTGASLFFLPTTRLPLPLKEEGLGIAFLGSLGFNAENPCAFSQEKMGISHTWVSCVWQLPPTNGSRWPNGVGLECSWCPLPTFPSKSHTGPHGPEFGSHRFFLGRFCSDKATKSFSSL